MQEYSARERHELRHSSADRALWNCDVDFDWQPERSLWFCNRMKDLGF